MLRLKQSTSIQNTAPAWACGGHNTCSLFSILVVQMRKINGIRVIETGRSYFGNTQPHISLAFPSSHNARCGIRCLQGRSAPVEAGRCILPQSCGRNPHSSRCFHRAWEAAAVKCFSLEVAHLSHAHSPLARTDHMAHLMTRSGTAMSQEPDMGDSGNLCHKGPCRNDSPG